MSVVSEWVVIGLFSSVWFVGMNLKLGKMRFRCRVSMYFIRTV